LAFVQKLDSENSLGEMEIKSSTKMKASILITLSTTIHGVSWDKSGKAFAAYFDDRNKKNGLLFKNWEQEKVYKFEADKFPGFPTHHSINPQGQYQLSISGDLSKVFFSIQENNNSEPDNNLNVEIWDAQKQLTYLQESLWKNAFSNKLGVWFPENHKFISITTNELPNSFLSGDGNYAVIFHPHQYEPQFEYRGPMDFYAFNLMTNEVNLILTKHNGYLPHLIPSPNGKYISYFHSGNWWVYNLEKKEHRNLTKFLNVRLENDINESNGEIQAYGIAGWTENENFLFVYDQFDIWKINTENGNGERITNGREKKIRFRITNFDNSSELISNFDGWMKKSLNLENGFFIKAQGDDASSGYYYWSLKSGLQKLVYKPSKIDQISITDDYIIFREQRYDLAPRIIKVSKNKKEKIIFESNSHQKKYFWGKAKPISYKISNGKELKGILYYPANFNPLKKYPMVVKIYEKQFHNFYSYIPPRSYSSTGFNITDFVLDGYFVLLPDIEYEINNVGMSAVDCVLAAVNKVKEEKYISGDKIGLIGHSFGGYETNFIITQTNLFAAAVSSAGVADLVSFYLNFNWENGKPDIWRFNNQIWRMNKSLFEDRSIYYSNSPISYIENIKTPLLCWTGNEDYQVNWHQSILWYLGLRKLNKKHILLVYPNEPHILLNLKNKEDVTKRVKQWFDHYLKNASMAS